MRINPLIANGHISGDLTEGFAQANMQCIGSNFLDFVPLSGAKGEGPCPAQCPHCLTSSISGEATERRATFRGRHRHLAAATFVGQVRVQAVILPDGSVEGWKGGPAPGPPSSVRHSLTWSTVGPGCWCWDGGTHPDVIRVPMACAGEGTMEVYVEPQLPAPDVHIVGSSPMAVTLADLCRTLGWRVNIVDQPVFEDVTPVSMILVATQGHYDEAAVEAALETPARYVGLVASEKRAASVRAWLQERGVTAENLARVRAPAGLDLGPVEHQEIAVAILGELVALKATGGFSESVEVAEPETTIDPVCKMTVEIATARFRSEHGGKTYYFCAAGCQRPFEANPAAFL